jgi:hypothetical protein
MENDLQALLDRAREVNPTEAELQEHRIALAVANGHYSDSRVTIDAMRASRTVAEQATKPK